MRTHQFHIKRRGVELVHKTEPITSLGPLFIVYSSQYLSLICNPEHEDGRTSLLVQGQVRRMRLSSYSLYTVCDSGLQGK